MSPGGWLSGYARCTRKMRVVVMVSRNSCIEAGRSSRFLLIMRVTSAAKSGRRCIVGQNRWGGCLEVSLQEFVRAATGKGRPPTQHFKDHAAEAIHVSARIKVFAANLFRRHVTTSSLDLGLAGEESSKSFLNAFRRLQSRSASLRGHHSRGNCPASRRDAPSRAGGGNGDLRRHDE